MRSWVLRTTRLLCVVRRISGLTTLLQLRRQKYRTGASWLHSNNCKARKDNKVKKEARVLDFVQHTCASVGTCDAQTVKRARRRRLPPRKSRTPEVLASLASSTPSNRHAPHALGKAGRHRTDTGPRRLHFFPHRPLSRATPWVFAFSHFIDVMGD